MAAHCRGGSPQGPHAPVPSPLVRLRTLLVCTVALAGVVLLTGAAADPAAGGTLSVPQAVVLGAVEGVTEYLPISSTGHLLIAEAIMGIGQGADKSATDTYTVVIQIGAILAVLGIYRHRFALMIGAVGATLRRADDEAGRQGRALLTALVIAFIPAAATGQLFGDWIKEHLLAPWPVIIAWAVGALLIFAFVGLRDRIGVRVDDVAALPVRTALGIGAAQVLALWPGTSRSLITILAAVALGVSLTAAVEFSFLLGFVTLSAATGYELLTNGSTLLDTFGVLSPLVGIAVAFVTAWASVTWMVSYLQGRSLAIFGWYRLAAAAFAIVLLATGVI